MSDDLALSLPLAPSPAPPVQRPDRLLALPGVYRPDDDSWLLAEMIAREPLAGADAVDLCTGSGVLAVTAGLAGGQVTAVDVCRRAVATARWNLRRHDVRGRVVRGALFEPLGERRYDAIVANPPYVPAARAASPSRGPRRAWDAGRDGRIVLDRLCAEAPRRLRPGGRVLLVQSEVADVPRTLEQLADGGLAPEVVARRAVPFGPVMRRRAARLVEHGLLPPGRRHEELVVVRAEAPR